MSAFSTRLLAGAAASTLAAGAAVAALGGAPAQATSVPACGNADLHASYGGAQGAAGHTYGQLRLTNVSGHACTTGGFSGVSYVGDGNGTQIGAPADRTDTAGVAFYVLRPGQRLHSPIDEVDALNYPKKRCRPTHVDGFRVYVPGSHRSQFVAHPTTGCRNAGVHLLSQKPLRRP